MTYEVIVPCDDTKDLNKIKFAISTAIRYLEPQPLAYHIISPNQLNLPYAKCHTDKSVLDLDINKVKFRRKKWIIQQFIKLFQNVTSTDSYIVIDSDLIFTNKFNIYTDNGDRQFWLSSPQHHEQYFNLHERLFGYRQIIPHSFISEIMMFDKNICQDMLNRLGLTVYELFDLICDLVGDGKEMLLGDYEFFGNYAMKYYPNLYRITKMNAHLMGKNYPYTDDEINDIIRKYDGGDYSVVTYHTWI